MSSSGEIHFKLCNCLVIVCFRLSYFVGLVSWSTQISDSLNHGHLIWFVSIVFDLVDRTIITLVDSSSYHSLLKYITLLILPLLFPFNLHIIQVIRGAEDKR